MGVVCHLLIIFSHGWAETEYKFKILDIALLCRTGFLTAQCTGMSLISTPYKPFFMGL